MKEGETRIPAGCAISGFINRSGRRTNGSVIVNSIACMHDRSNGLGGGYAGYGIYPEYKDQYAFHVFHFSTIMEFSSNSIPLISSVLHPRRMNMLS